MLAKVCGTAHKNSAAALLIPTSFFVPPFVFLCIYMNNIMNIKKITVISLIILTVISLIAVKLIFPIETEISEIKRFYDISLIKTNLPDNTSFEDILDKHLDIQFDLVHTKGLFTESLRGTITIGNEQYLIFTRDNDNLAAFGGGSGSPDNSIMYIGDDLSHFMLVISEKLDVELSGVWLNCTDYADYKSAITEFYPNL